MICAPTKRYRTGASHCSHCSHTPVLSLFFLMNPLDKAVFWLTFGSIIPFLSISRAIPNFIKLHVAWDGGDFSLYHIKPRKRPNKKGPHMAPAIWSLFRHPVQLSCIKIIYTINIHKPKKKIYEHLVVVNQQSYLRPKNGATFSWPKNPS